MKNLVHHPVLLHEVIELLVTKKDGTYLDCTVGLGGHSLGILDAISTAGRLIGIDRDREALDFARQRLQKFPNVQLFHLNFSRIDRLKQLAGIDKFSGILFDLGMGTWQIEINRRGFSYLSDGPLDMRMDAGQELTASEVVNSYSPEELERIFKEYGEEKLSRKIAKNIKNSPIAIQTTAQLRDAVERSVPSRHKIKSLSRIFQAIRMEVNHEIDELKAGLNLALQAVEPNGRVGVIAYHSLEDRLVKETFRELSRKCTCPPEALVCTCGGKAKWKAITKKPLRPGPAEIQSNPSARSAKFRVIEKLPSDEA